MQACRSYYDLLADRYLPNEMTSEMYTLFATHILLGKPEIEQYFEQLCEDAKTRRSSKAATASSGCIPCHTGKTPCARSSISVKKTSFCALI